MVLRALLTLLFRGIVTLIGILAIINFGSASLTLLTGVEPINLADAVTNLLFYLVLFIVLGFSELGLKRLAKRPHRPTQPRQVEPTLIDIN